MEILIELGEADQVPAIASYFAKQLEHPERLKSPRFVPELLRSRMIAVGKQLIDKGFYDLAATYARILPNLCTDADRIRIESEAHRKHGEYLVREAGGNVDRFGNSSARLSTKEFKDAKPYFQRAGKLYEKLAFMELRSSDYADLLWTAIECYQSSDELERSNDLIDLYMNLERKSNTHGPIWPKVKTTWPWVILEMRSSNSASSFKTIATIPWPIRLVPSPRKRSVNNFSSTTLRRCSMKSL